MTAKKVKERFGIKEDTEDEMEPLINPWVFYYIEVLDRVSTGIAIGMFACVAVATFSGMDYYDFDATETTKRRSKKMIKAAVILFLFFGLAQILIPGKRTMYQMLAARYVTAENIEAVQNNVVDFVGRIADGLAKVKK